MNISNRLLALAGAALALAGGGPASTRVVGEYQPRRGEVACDPIINHQPFKRSKKHRKARARRAS